MILEKQIPSISEKFGSLSVRITGNKALKASIPILSSSLSKNATTLLELGLLIMSNKVNCKFGKINVKILLLSVFMAPRKSSCQT